MSGIGEQLRKAREAKGLSISDIEKATKIQSRYLEAIENNDFDKLPGDFYVRAFIRQYAQIVGLDGKELLSQYQGEVANEVTSEVSQPAETPASSDPAVLPLEISQPSLPDSLFAPDRSRYTCILDWPTFDTWLKKIEAAPLTALDTETTSLDPFSARLVGISFAVSPARFSAKRHSTGPAISMIAAARKARTSADWPISG